MVLLTHDFSIIEKKIQLDILLPKGSQHVNVIV